MTVGVRGDYTAEVLWEIGVRNVRVIGCPTLFRRRDPELRIDLPPLETIRRVAFTLRREVSATYARDIKRYLDLQKRVILDLAERFPELVISAQGEIEEKKLVIGTPEQGAEALAQLDKAGWLDSPEGRLTALYRDRLFYSDVVADYDDLVRQQQLTLGYRLHGNLIALANRVPSIYFTYDSRTAEFAETFKIPAFDVFAGEPFDLERYWDQAYSSASIVPITTAGARWWRFSRRTGLPIAWGETLPSRPFPLPREVMKSAVVHPAPPTLTGAAASNSDTSDAVGALEVVTAARIAGWAADRRAFDRRIGSSSASARRSSRGSPPTGNAAISREPGSATAVTASSGDPPSRLPVERLAQIEAFALMEADGGRTILLPKRRPDGTFPPSGPHSFATRLDQRVGGAVPTDRATCQAAGYACGRIKPGIHVGGERRHGSHPAVAGQGYPFVWKPWTDSSCDWTRWRLG